jgi:hypothetical protein
MDIFDIIIMILGLIIGLLIGYFIFNNNTYIGPNSNEIKKEIYEDEDGRKYKWDTVVCICPVSYSMDKLKDPNYKDFHEH